VGGGAGLGHLDLLRARPAGVCVAPSFADNYAHSEH
jgi:hypothetical protein